MRLEVLAHTTGVRVEVLHVAAQNTGRAGLANKGGIVAEILVNGRTRLSFLTAHLEAHEGRHKYETRVSTLADILSGTKAKQHDCSLTAHFSFALGDLNFRSELPNHAEVDDKEHMRIVRDMAERKDWEALNQIDELQRALRNKECLVGYQTLFCNFPPTFKVERQAGYAYIDKRRPSYTDRILWKTNHGLDDKIRPLVYEPIDDFTSSDHKPIRAAFAVKLNEPYCFRPKMTRRRSISNFGNILSKKRDKSLVLVHKERFHLFVSDLSCEIYGKSKSIRPGQTDRSQSAPNPYVCLVSDPPAALRQKIKKGWQRWNHALQRAFEFRARRLVMTSFVNAKGYPRSSIKKQTLAAHWENEEIHSEVQTHLPDGSPIDLSGAMLRLTVMDSRSTDDVVIGSFVCNLVNLIRSCRPSNCESTWRILATRARSKRVVERSLKQSQRQGSVLSLFSKRGSQESDDHPDPPDVDPIEAIEIDEPIVKNGVETGRIKCKIEAWWMHDWAANNFNGSGSGSLPFHSSRATNGSEEFRGVLSERRSTPTDNSARKRGVKGK